MRQHFYEKLIFIESLRILAISLDGKSPYKIAKLDLTSGKKVNEFWKYDKIPDDVPIEAAKDANAAEIYTKPSGDKIALAYNRADDCAGGLYLK